MGIQSCLTKCNIKNTTQPTTQQQPRVLGNGFTTDPALARRRNLDESHFMKRSQDVQEQVPTTPTTVYSILSSANPQSIGELVFLLKIVIGVMLAGYLFTWVYFVIPTWKYRRMQAEIQAQAAASTYARLQDDKA